MANTSSNTDNLPCQTGSLTVPPVNPQPNTHPSGLQANPQPNQNVFKFTDYNSKVTGNTFPSRENLIEILYENQFNCILQLIKTKILNVANENLNSIRVLVPDVAHFKPQIVTSVKTWLTDKGYTITEIEDANGQSTGWKLSW